MMGSEKYDIDKLFRERLDIEESPLIFPEKDWSTLEGRLDRFEKKKRVIFFARTFSGVAAVLLLAFVIYALWPTDMKQNDQTEIVEQAERGNINQSEVPTEEQETEAEPGITMEANDSSPILGINESVTAQSLDHPEVVMQDMTSSEDGNLQEETTLSEANVPESLDESLKQTTPQVDSIKQENMDQFFAQEPESLYESEKKQHKMTLSIFVAPDYTGVDNLNNSKAGTNIGLLFTLGLTKNWSVSTGAIYAKKLYEKVDNGGGYGNYYTQSVNADCRVLDIPLNLSYNILKLDKTTISIGTGISSYIMLREDYQFSSFQSGNEDMEELHLVNENQHWLSVLNFQANFERKLSSNMSISFQPFMKLPLSEVGYAKVKLQSVGLAVNANWSF